jgi:hypothetical protein
MHDLIYVYVCSVLDVVVNGSVVSECNSDKSGEAKEEVLIEIQIYTAVIMRSMYPILLYYNICMYVYRHV